ncbi:hypothetical protein [Bradyrhizobium embrapense]
MQLPKDGEPIRPLLVEYRFEQMRDSQCGQSRDQKMIARQTLRVRLAAAPQPPPQRQGETTCSSAANVRIEAARSVGGVVLREITRAMAISGFVGRTVIGMDALDWNDGGKRIRRRFVPCEPCIKARSRPSTHEPWL